MSGARRLALVLAVVAGCGGAAAGGGASSAPSSTGAEASSAPPSTTTATLTSDEGPSTDLADYARRTMAIVRRHWSVPAALGAPDTVVLESSIEIVIDPRGWWLSLEGAIPLARESEYTDGTSCLAWQNGMQHYVRRDAVPRRRDCLRKRNAIPARDLPQPATTATPPSPYPLRSPRKGRSVIHAG